MARAPDFIPFQLVKLVSKPPAGERWLHEIKFDGYRMQVRVEGGRARFHTRNGHDWTDKFRALWPDAGEPAGLHPRRRTLRRERRRLFRFLGPAIGAWRPHRRPGLFVFDILFEGYTDLRPFSLTTARRACGRCCSTAASTSPTPCAMSRRPPSRPAI